MKTSNKLLEIVRQILGTAVSDHHFFGSSLEGYVRETDLLKQCQELLSVHGEATGAFMAKQILATYLNFDKDQKKSFLIEIAQNLDVDIDAIQSVVQEYAMNSSPTVLEKLLKVTEPPRQELFRSLNFAPEGTASLVAMRKDVLEMIKDNPLLKRIELDLKHLLSSWFNRGFLVLKQVDWNTSACILEKIIQYEAVHEIRSWEELKRRLDAKDRKCFAFFHPSMPDEPLIFVEVALMQEIPDAVPTILAKDRQIVSPDQANTAAFYGISSCQKGLSGISFGHFLIKQVCLKLAQDLPNLQSYATLSPVPSLMKWIRKQAKQEHPIAKEILQKMPEPTQCKKDDESLKKLLLSFTKDYLLHAKNQEGFPYDPVARFHLSNGAILNRINWYANSVDVGLQQSAGIMVNYCYDLDQVKIRHEAYAIEQKVNVSKTIQKMP